MKIMASLLSILLIVCSGCATTSGRQESVAVKWQLVAKSDLILKVRLGVPVQKIRNHLATRKYDYVNIKASVLQVYKGTHGNGSMVIQYYTKPRAYAPAPEDIISMNRNTAIVYLLRRDIEGKSVFYFAGHTSGAIEKYNSLLTLNIQREIESQRQLLLNFDTSKAAEEDIYDKRVGDLIEKMISPKTEERAFIDLETLGCKAVPAIIRKMNDRRLLPIQHIGLENRWPGAFEGIRHYGPQVVVDALAAILNQITMESFGDIESGGSEAERQQCIDGWKIYSQKVDVVSECMNKNSSL